MKKSIFYLIIVLPTIILNSCNLNDPKPSHLNIQGKWQLESFRGAWTGGDYAPGTGPILIFKKKTYQEFKGDTLVRGGSYQLVKAHRTLVDREGDRLDLDKGVFGGMFVSLYEDKLILSPDMYDAPSYSYKKIE